MQRSRSFLALLCAATIGISTASAHAETTIRITAAPAGWNPMFEALATQFEKEHPDIKVNVEAQNRDFEALTEQTLREAVIGQLPDIMITGSNQIRAFAERGLAIDLQPLMVADSAWEQIGYTAAAAETGRIDGHLYGLTLAASMPVIFYNKDLVAKAGVDPEKFPTDWPAIIDLGQKIGNEAPDTSGLFFEHDSNGNWTYFALLESAGGKAATPDDEIAFDSKEGLWALDVLHQIGAAGQAQADMTRDQARQAFAAGKLGALVSSSSNLGAFESQVGDRFNIGVGQFPVPSPDGRLPVAGLSAVMFSKDAQQADAAWKFLEFAMTPSSQATIVQATGMIPFNEKAITDPASLAPVYASDPLFAAALVNRDLVTSWYSFPGPNSIKIFSTIKDVLAEVATLKTAPDQALAEMRTKVEALLAP